MEPSFPSGDPGRVLKAFAAHYGPMNVLESVQPGICGDYGESIMPVHGNWPGAYHTHVGYWCGGDDARESYIAWLADRYGDVWHAERSVAQLLWESGGGVEPLPPHKAPSRTAQFDMLDWYRDSMTEYTEFWMEECRTWFPDLPGLHARTGGIEKPENASSFSDQAEVCAKHGGGIRLTNRGQQVLRKFLQDGLYKEQPCHDSRRLYGPRAGGTDDPHRCCDAHLRLGGLWQSPDLPPDFNNLFERGRPEPKMAAGAVKEYLGLIRDLPLPKSVGVFWPGLLHSLAWRDSPRPAGMP